VRVRQAVRWAEDVVDNEALNKKKSKSASERPLVQAGRHQGARVADAQSVCAPRRVLHLPQAAAVWGLGRR